MRFLPFLFPLFLTVSLTHLPRGEIRVETEKPLCGLCLNMVKQLDDVLQHGGDIEKAVDKFCKEDVPSFLVDMCDKVIEKNLEAIIEKLKDHEAAEKICSDIYLCRAE